MHSMYGYLPSRGEMQQSAMRVRGSRADGGGLHDVLMIVFGLERRAGGRMSERCDPRRRLGRWPLAVYLAIALAFALLSSCRDTSVPARKDAANRTDGLLAPRVIDLG